METNLKQSSLVEPTVEPKRKSSGPPNRMNDLIYRDWMKFQKSFSRQTDPADMIEEYVEFFTKETWQDGRNSKSLILTSEVGRELDLGARVLVRHSLKRGDVMQAIHALSSENPKFDYAYIDLRNHFNAISEWEDFLIDHAELFASRLRDLMIDDSYLTVLIQHNELDSNAFPIPWSLAQRLRGVLKLRDEKVHLDRELNLVTYALNFQATADARPTSPYFRSKTVQPHPEAPLWVMPKSPPRKRNEVLHPAKFPETLIEPFIRLYTHEGDWVIDPMVGTGSSVIAAMQARRNGMGIELSEEFASIAKHRVQMESQPTLFETEGPQARGVIVQGDATDLKSMSELQERSFQYMVTSPPYWSMLNNPGSENQRNRKQKNLKTVYSDEDRDLGNMPDYDHFVEALARVYGELSQYMDSGSFLTIVVKNVKRDHTLYPLAWDLAQSMTAKESPFSFAGVTLWCQDDIGLKPFAVGTHWVSNILHNYCLHFRVD